MGPASKGMIIGRWCICGGPMPISAAPNIYFFKGNWTKEVAGASEKADRAIDEAIASRKSKSP
jgi:hypothetical protein